MKKNFQPISLIFWILTLVGFSYWYQQYWFSEYKEKSWISSFSCTNQCYITLGQKWNIDYMNLKWTLNWNWVAAYWFNIWWQIAIINQFNVFGIWQVDESIKFSDYTQYLSSVPNDADLIFLVNWNVKWEVDIVADMFSFSEKISQGWKGFWNMETFTPYSINLRYWITINWISIIKYWYILFILIAILVLLFKKWKKEQKLKTIFYVWIWIFIFIWIRNTITYTSILHQWLEWFANNKTYFDLWDYVWFTNKIREKLNLDSKEFTKDDCKIYIKSYQEWPFVSHRESFYLKPCERVLTWELANYLIYYKTNISSEDSSKKVLVDYNNSYLLENNSK